MPFLVPDLEQTLISFAGGGLKHLKPKQDNGVVDLLVWNVFKGQRGRYFITDFKKLARDKDFILLQEALIPKDSPHFFHPDFQNYHWHMAQSFQYKKDLSSTGVAIGSAHDLHFVDFARAPERELFWLTPKMSIFSKVQYGSSELLLVCTHALNFVTTGAFVRSMEEIAKMISQHQGPVVLAGDFNTWNVKRFLAMRSIFGNLHLEHIDLADDQRILKLDHVFVRGLQVKHAKVHHQVSSSDHFPIELTLQLGADRK